MVLADLKKFDAAMAIVYVIAIFITFIGVLVLIIMIIGNNTFLGKNYEQINDKVSSLVKKNVLNQEQEEETTEKKDAYLYGHPWLMVILVFMTSITAVAYIIKGLLYILSQHHENELKRKMLECIGSNH